MEIENLKEVYGTLSQTINALAKLGYTHDFNVQEDCLVCRGNNVKLEPHELQIDKIYRFEGDADPDYQSILYAISSIEGGVKGVLVNGYGISADVASMKFIDKVNDVKKQ